MIVNKIRKKAFTLVDLLVVIAIIALLLAMLVPALNAARERTRELVCAANMRQLGMASHSYSTTTGYMPVYSIWLAHVGGVAYASSDPILGDRSGRRPI